MCCQEHIDNNKVREIATELKKEGKKEIKSDVDGSYTGLSSDKEKPVQDVDDL